MYYSRSLLDTRAEVYDQLKVKPPIKRHVKMILAGNKARLRGFVASPFDVRV